MQVTNERQAREMASVPEEDGGLAGEISYGTGLHDRARVGPGLRKGTVSPCISRREERLARRSGESQV